MKFIPQIYAKISDKPQRKFGLTKFSRLFCNRVIFENINYAFEIEFFPFSYHFLDVGKLDYKGVVCEFGSRERFEGFCQNKGVMTRNKGYFELDIIELIVVELIFDLDEAVVYFFNNITWEFSDFYHHFLGLCAENLDLSYDIFPEFEHEELAKGVDPILAFTAGRSFKIFNFINF